MKLPKLAKIVTAGTLGVLASVTSINAMGKLQTPAQVLATRYPQTKRLYATAITVGARRAACGYAFNASEEARALGLESEAMDWRAKEVRACNT